MNDRESFGIRLRRLREELGLSLPELAARAGVPALLLEEMEGNARWPRLGQVEKLARTLGIEPHLLLRDT